MSAALNYETFLRTAFGYAQGGEMLDRWGDPAGIADTDLFNDNDIAQVKAGTGYAMEILSNAVHNHIGDRLPEEEITRIEQFTKDVIAAESLDRIDQLITQFRESVVEKYFDMNNGILTLKSR